MCPITLLATARAGRLVRDRNAVGGARGEALRAEPVECCGSGGGEGV